VHAVDVGLVHPGGDVDLAEVVGGGQVCPAVTHWPSTALLMAMVPSPGALMVILGCAPLPLILIRPMILVIGDRVACSPAQPIRVGDRCVDLHLVAVDLPLSVLTNWLEYAR